MKWPNSQQVPPDSPAQSHALIWLKTWANTLGATPTTPLTQVVHPLILQPLTTIQRALTQFQSQKSTWITQFLASEGQALDRIPFTSKNSLERKEARGKASLVRCRATKKWIRRKFCPLRRSFQSWNLWSMESSAIITTLSLQMTIISM